MELEGEWNVGLDAVVALDSLGAEEGGPDEKVAVDRLWSRSRGRK